MNPTAAPAKKRKKPGCCCCCSLVLFLLLVVVPVSLAGFAYWYFMPLPSPLEQEFQTIPDYFPPRAKEVAP